VSDKLTRVHCSSISFSNTGLGACAVVQYETKILTSGLNGFRVRLSSANERVEPPAWYSRAQRGTPFTVMSGVTSRQHDSVRQHTVAYLL
jgi:hypothetical protein